MLLHDDKPSSSSVVDFDDNDDKSNLLRPMLHVNSLPQKSVNNFFYNKFFAATLRYANSFTAVQTTTKQQQVQISSATPLLLTYDDYDGAGTLLTSTLPSIIPVPVWNGSGGSDGEKSESNDYGSSNNNNAAATTIRALVTATTVTPPSPTAATSAASSPATFLSHRLARHIASSSASYFFHPDNGSDVDDVDNDSEYFDLIDVYRQYQRRHRHRHHRISHRQTSRFYPSSTATPLKGDVVLDGEQLTSTSNLNGDEAAHDVFNSSPDSSAIDQNPHVFLPAVHHRVRSTTVGRLQFKSFGSSTSSDDSVPLRYGVVDDDDEVDWVSARSTPSSAYYINTDDDDSNSNIVSVDVVNTNPWTNNIDVDVDDDDDNLSDTSKSLAILRDSVFDSKQQLYAVAEEETPAITSSLYDFNDLININSTASSTATSFELGTEATTHNDATRRNLNAKYYNPFRAAADADAQNQISILPPSNNEQFFVAKSRFNTNPSAASFYQAVTTMVDTAIGRNGTTTWATTTSSSIFPPQLSALISDDSFMEQNNSTASDLLEHFADSNLDHSHSAVRATILGIVFILMIVVTVVGNLFVIAAVYYERPLRKMTCNYYIVSLAVSDLMLGALIVPFSALYEVTGEWVFGNVWCTVWLSLDVLATTSSILGLMLISVDRYLAVTRPLNYYRYSSTKFVITAVVAMWALSMLITTAPVFGFEGIVVEQTSGRVQCNVGGGLVWTLYSAVGSFFFPLTIMVVLNLRIYKIAERQSAALHEEFKRLQHIYSHLGPPEEDRDGEAAEQHAKLNSNHNSHQHNNNDVHIKLTANDSAFSSNGPSVTTTTNNNNGVTNGKIDEKNHNSADGTKHQHQRSSDTSLGAKARRLLSSNHVSTRSVHKMRRFSKQHRAAKTLSFVMACFTVCYVPFFTIYLIEGIATHWNVNLIGPIPFKVAFWLGYFNSALNPFIYALSNRDFRRAFLKLFHCYYCRDYSDWHDMMRKPSWAMYHRPSSSVTERTRLQQQQRQLQLQRQSTAYCEVDDDDANPPASPVPATVAANAYIDFGSKQQDGKALLAKPNNNILPDGGSLVAATAITSTDEHSEEPPVLTGRRQSTPDHQRVAVICEELRQSLTTTTLPALQTIALSTAPFSRRSSSTIGVSTTLSVTAQVAQQSNVHSQLSVESPYIISSLEHHQERTPTGTSTRAKQKRPSIVVSPENANEMALAIYVGDEYDKEFFRSFAADDDEDDEDEDHYEGSYSLRPHNTTETNRQHRKQHLFGKRRQISAPSAQTTSVLVTGASPEHAEPTTTPGSEGLSGETDVKTTPRRKLSATITASASFLIRTLQGHRHQPRSDVSNRARRVSFSDPFIAAQHQNAAVDVATEMVGVHEELPQRRRNLFWNSEPIQITSLKPDLSDDGPMASAAARKLSEKSTKQHNNENRFTATATRLARSLTMPVKFRKSPFADNPAPSSQQHQNTAHESPANISSLAKQTVAAVSSSESPPQNNPTSSAVSQRTFSDASDSVITNSRRSPSPFPAECPRCGLHLQDDQQQQQQQQYSIEESPASIVNQAKGGGEPLIKIHKPPTNSNHLNVRKSAASVLVCNVGINTEPIQLMYEQFNGPNSLQTHSNDIKQPATHPKSRQLTSSRNSTSDNLSSEQQQQQQKAKQCGVQTSYSVFDMGSF